LNEKEFSAPAFKLANVLQKERQKKERKRYSCRHQVRNEEHKEREAGKSNKK
jgi:hypothetical protein